VSGFEAILLALLVILPWGEGGAAPTSLAVVQTIIFVAVAALLRRTLKSGSIEVRLSWPLLAYLAFLAVGGVGLLRSEYLYGSFETYWDQIAALLLALALAGTAPTERFARTAAAAICGLGAAQALPAIVSRCTVGAALSPSFVNPNHLAAYLNVAAFVALERGGWLPAREGQEGTREAAPGPRPGPVSRLLLWRAGALLCAAGVLAVGSRGALLALTITLLVLIARAGSARARAWMRAVPVVIVLAALAVLSVQSRFASNVDPYRYDRPRLWTAALSAWREAPLLGLGPGMYEHRAARHNFPQDLAVFRYSKEPHSAHSQPLQTLAEEGVAGLLTLLVFAGAIVVALAGARKVGGEAAASARALLPACAALAIHALFETPFEAPAIPITLLLLAWPALRPASFGASAAAFVLRWPDRETAARERWATVTSAAVCGVVLFSIGVAAPYLSYLAVRYAEGEGRAPVRIDLAFRTAEALNPHQPFLGFRRARAALARSRRVSPTLLANAMDSLETTIRLEPGDPSAYALLGGLYARAAADLPGAGAGAIAEAERRYTEALAVAPLDARLHVERGSLRLSAGEAAGALADALAALQLEPRALAAHQLEVEALLASGREKEAAAGLGDMEKVLADLSGYQPLNGYEEALLRVDGRGLLEMRRRLGPLLLVPSAGGLLRGGHGDD
jgi:O-antigen ligase